MKRIITSILVLLALVAQVNAQNIVGTEPTNRNAILEEFTGRNCGYCPDGHRIANELMAAHPGRFWAINIHAGGYAPTTYPNMTTTKGTTIHNGFSIDGYPMGIVSRNGTVAQDRGAWAGTLNTILAQPSCLNVAGTCIVDPTTRIATINVEVYYTGNSNATTNQLTIVMLQDSILGSQADYGNFNPTQWADETHTVYIHTHVFRDVVNSTSAWGETISPTTQGTLIQRTYTYQVPETIGNPNGVEVVLDNLKFIAFVSESNYYVTSANELTYVVNYGPIFPKITNFQQEDVITCSTEKNVELSLFNGGSEAINTMTLQFEYQGQTYTHEWEGTIPSYTSQNITFPLTLPYGSDTATIRVTNVNGTELEPSITNTSQAYFEVPQWISNVNTQSITVNIWQDRYGQQITWELLASDNSVLASGGPYSPLGGNTTKLRTKTVQITNPDCMRFAIYDSNCDGINNGHGEGHYNLVDSDGNIIFASNGTYDCSELTDMSVNQGGTTSGDTNGDGLVNVLDVQNTIAYILGHNPSPFVFINADVNNDGIINIMDVQAICTIINGGK